MSTPIRVQLSRKKGWRKPENTVVVARPSRWGNPFPIPGNGREYAIRFFVNWLTNSLDAEGRYCDGRPTYLGVPSSQRPTLEEIRAELGGKNLACWCPLDQPCHADVLLRIANGAIS
ncbi:DUF4326 domain-containing protein [Microbacterium maritypicum]|uniref:DUF4326 domain-containing protein n=2 Tax=Microbacterium maritypicum TaxID=33918 RepID=A0ACD4B933_MICMQ|nr:DUF4326 domain-containing protein [Microbacterium liquefaciens]UTT53781.1 DUF4326 domain-containing protein [Microbacterium liquefaciens]UTT53846.1 DUF4326 domain-containing protein [Microbacterium liquefaciens]